MFPNTFLALKNGTFLSAVCFSAFIFADANIASIDVAEQQNESVVSALSDTQELLTPESLKPTSLKSASLKQARLKQVQLTFAQIYSKLLIANNNSMLWFANNRLSMPGFSLQNLLADLGYVKQTAYTKLSPEQISIIDQALTNGLIQLLLLQYSTEQHVQAKVGKNFNYQNKQALQSSPQLIFDNIQQSLTEQTTDELILSLMPQYDQVTHLRTEIAKYRFLAKYQWPKLNSKFLPKLGQSNKKIINLRKILVTLGDMPEKAQTPGRLDVYDSVVVAALKKFQFRHGLTADGKLGPKTYKALNVPPQQRIVQLQNNLWRWFTLPKQPPENYLLVNIPSFQLFVIEQEQQKLQMKVIVGDIDNPTPELITHIDRVTLNPTWTPTRNIIDNELIPEFKADYLSLKRKDFQLVKGYWKNAQTLEIDSPNLNIKQMLKSYRLVQAPGKKNALGYYRFNIKNDHSVYLHDTPVKSLFNQSARALSHGCIRLEDAKKLAQYLLNQQNELSNTALKTVLTSGETTNYLLNKPLPVYVTYQTAWVNEQGELIISPDIYQQERKNLPLAQFGTTVSNPVITLSQNNF